MNKIYYIRNIKLIHAFFISNIFISGSRLKLAKSQANAKDQCEAELLLFRIYSHSSCENNRTYSKEQVCLNSWDYTINQNDNEDENEERSHRYNINIPTSRHGHKYSKYKKCLAVWWC